MMKKKKIDVKKIDIKEICFRVKNLKRDIMLFEAEICSPTCEKSKRKIEQYISLRKKKIQEAKELLWSLRDMIPQTQLYQ